MSEHARVDGEQPVVSERVVMIPCREYDPPSLRCWPCAQGRPEDCLDPIIGRQVWP